MVQRTWWDENAPIDETAMSGGVVTPGVPGPEGTYTAPAVTPLPQVQTGSAVRTPYSDAAFQQILAKYPPTNEGIQAALAEANQTFGTSLNVLQHPTKLDKVQLPDGRIVDVIVGAGGTSPSWGWMPEGSTMPGAPYATYGTGGGPYPLYGVGGQGYMQPFDVAFRSPGDFRAPTVAEMTQDPGFQFRMQEGTKAIERAAAAKGTLVSGGTLKDLQQYAQGLASQEYGNVYARRLGENELAYTRAMNEYLNAFNVFNTNQNTGWNRLGYLSNIGYGTAQNQANTATGYGLNLATLYGQQGNAQASGIAGAGSAWGSFWPYVGNLGAQVVWNWPTTSSGSGGGV